MRNISMKMAVHSRATPGSASEDGVFRVVPVVRENPRRRRKLTTWIRRFP
jgi:hypothetical protein